MRVKAGAAYKLGMANPTTYPASLASAATLFHTKVTAASASATQTITAPVNNFATTSRTAIPVGLQVNIDNDEAATSPALTNVGFGTTDPFLYEVLEGSTVLASSNALRKTGATPATTRSAERQVVTATIDGPLAIGVHNLTHRIKDPLGNVIGTPPTAKVLVWDRPQLALVNGVAAPQATPNTFIVDRTTSITFAGSRFSVGNDTSDVTMTIDGVSAGANTATDPTKFSFSVSSLTAGSHTVVLTQTYSGSNLSGTLPTLSATYTVDNSSGNLDTVAPVGLVVGAPTNNATVVTSQPTISGNAEAGSTVAARYSLTGANSWTTLSTVTANASTGAFSFGAAEWGANNLVANSSYDLQVRATDSAGNSSAWTDAQVTISSAAAAVKVAISPSSGVAAAAVDGKRYSNTATAVFTLPLTAFDGTAISSGAVTGLATTDFTVTNGSITASALTTAGSLSITVTAAAAGPVTIALPAGAFTFGSTANEAATSFTYVKDSVAPTFTTAVLPNSNSTSAVGTSFKLVLTANEPIASADSTKVVAAFAGTGTTLPTIAFNSTTGFSADRKTVTFTASGAVPGAATGVTFTFTAAALTDLGGNTSAAVTAATPAKAWDNTAPDLTSIASTAAAVGKVAPLPYTITFTEPVTGFDLSKLDITNGIATVFSGTGATYTLTVVPGEGPSPVRVAIKTGTVVTDGVGLTATVSGSTVGKHLLTRIYDSTPPRVVSLASSTTAPTSTNDNPTNLTSIPVSLVFSEAVTGLTAASFQVDNGTISSFAGSASAYSFNVDVAAPTADVKKIRVLLAAGKVSDSVGNLNSSVAVLLRNYDGIVPTLDFAAPSLTGTAGTAESKASFTLNVNNSGTSDVKSAAFDATKIQVNGGTIESITPTSSGGLLTSVQVLVVFPRAIGNAVTVTALPGAITDIAGNRNATSSRTLVIDSNG